MVTYSRVVCHLLFVVCTFCRRLDLLTFNSLLMDIVYVRRVHCVSGCGLGHSSEVVAGAADTTFRHGTHLSCLQFAHRR